MWRGLSSECAGVAGIIRNVEETREEKAMKVIHQFNIKGGLLPPAETSELSRFSHQESVSAPPCGGFSHE